MSCLQLSKGDFQAVFPLSLWSRSSQVITVPFGHWQKIIHIDIDINIYARQRFEEIAVLAEGRIAADFPQPLLPGESKLSSGSLSLPPRSRGWPPTKSFIISALCHEAACRNMPTELLQGAMRSSTYSLRAYYQ